MSTNYYLRSEYGHCPSCTCSDGEGFHLGKSSGGWRFSLRVYPERDITNWAEMLLYLANALADKESVHIEDEYGRFVSLADFQAVVERRTDNRKEWLNYLNVHEIDGTHCIGAHSTLPIDYCIGEFC